MFSWFSSSVKIEESTQPISTPSSSSNPASRTRSKFNRRLESSPPVLPTSLERIIKKSKTKPQHCNRAVLKSSLFKEFLNTQTIKTSVSCSGTFIPIGLDLTMAPDPKVELKSDETCIVSKLAGLKNRLDAHKPTATPPVLLSPVEVSMLIEDIEKQVKNLDSIESRTYRLYSETDILAGGGPNLTGLNLEINQLRFKIKDIQSQYEIQATSASLVKREAIPLPKFDGDSSKWAEFKDQYDAAFHNDSRLSSSVKLQNLKNLMIVDSPPSRLLSGFTICDTNYPLAYKTLVDRYENKKELVFSYIKSIFDLPILVNAGGLQNLIDTIKTSLQKTESLGITVDDWDPIIVFMIYERLDYNSRKDVEKAHPDSKIPTLDDLFKTLQPIASSFKPYPSKPKDRPKDSNQQKQQSSSSSSAKLEQSSNSKSTPRSCFICHSSEHWTSQCTQITSLSTVKQRVKLLKDKSLCTKCLKNHPPENCKWKNSCQTPTCQDVHHKILCPILLNSSQTSLHAEITSSSSEILPTVMLEFIDHNGKNQMFRGLLDSGSQVNIISERAMILLRSPRRSSSLKISGLGDSSGGKSKGVTTIKTQSIYKLWRQDLEFFIMPHVSNSQPQKILIGHDKWNHLKNLPLADSTFHTPGHIDFILSSGVYAEIKRGGIQRGAPNQPVAEETDLGWVVMGKTTESHPSASSFHCECNVDFDLSQFWKQEEIPVTQPLLSDEFKAIESHFLATHSRDSEGRYEVELPFNSSAPDLGNSKNQAFHRFLNKEKSLNKNPNHKKLYKEQIDQLLDRQYLVPVPLKNINCKDNEAFYLPHHGVFKESSTTTKLRIVKDASMKTSSGLSLNDVLMNGPTIQPELSSTLMKFRKHQIAFTSDIEKMFHQIKVKEDHQNYLRLLWRDNVDQPIQIFNLTRVPFGSRPSTFLAVRCYQQLSKDEGEKFPLAAPVMLEDFYIDDCSTGGPDLKYVIHLQQQLREISSLGGFHLTKFMSNSPEFLESIPPEDRASDFPVTFHDGENIKTLGIKWNPKSDTFSFSTHCEEKQKYTKRDVVSITARIFDPNGLVQPVIVPAKLIIQQLWKEKIDWNDHLPPFILSTWSNYLQQLSSMDQISIPRKIMYPHATNFQLHGFSDASKSAYGAAVYLRSEYPDGSFSSHLIAAKSRLTPLSSSERVNKNPGRTIPQLELNGAVVLAQLSRSVNEALHLPIIKIFYWCDSSITLWRIKNPKLKNDSHVSRKIEIILSLSSPDEWYYVNTKENPADILSRGLAPALLCNNNLWWNGPTWLSSSTFPISPIPGSPLELGLKEEERVVNIITTSISSLLLNPKYRTLSGLLRASALIKRGISFLQSKFKKDNKILIQPHVGPLKVIELEEAELLWIKSVQHLSFPEEIKAMEKNKPVKRSSQLLNLNPFLLDGIIRVGGRLENSTLTENSKHPIILTKNHPFVVMLIRRAHHKLLHAGTRQTHTEIREKYWIIHGHSTIKKVISKCLICLRFNSRPAQQLMGELPRSRVSPEKIFNSVGIDYAGPLQVSASASRSTRARPQSSTPAYIAVFICMSTRLIHLEAVTGLSTEKFLQALTRFSSVWGCPSQIHSDNGKNFEGANNELRSLFNYLQSSDFSTEIQEKTSQKGITWIFNSPRAPHQGGLWEAAVKSVKSHLKRIYGNENFTFEELATVLSQIQGILNSRPLYPIDVDNAGNALTPSHFYLGQRVTAPPAPDLSTLKMSHLNRYQHLLRLSQDFQSVFKKEYLSHLQKRFKWSSPSPNIKVGQFCFLIGENQPASKWSTGEIMETHIGKDGLVRNVTIKTDDGIYLRSIHKVIPFPVSESDSTDSRCVSDSTGNN